MATLRFLIYLKRYPVWFTGSILTKIKEKKRLWNNYKRTKLLPNHDSVKDHLASSNMRSVWSLKTLLSLPNTVSKMIQEVLALHSIKEAYCWDSRRIPIVNAFVTHFPSLYIQVCNLGARFCEFCCTQSCPSLCSDFNCKNTNHPILSMFVINENNIISMSKRIKSNIVCGPDEIPVFLLKDY